MDATTIIIYRIFHLLIVPLTNWEFYNERGAVGEGYVEIAFMGILQRADCSVVWEARQSGGTVI